MIRADSRKTKTRAPGTVDFMPPEALLEVPEYDTPLDVFSYGGVMLHIVNQEWPKPLHYVMTDPKTGKNSSFIRSIMTAGAYPKLINDSNNIRRFTIFIVKQFLDDNSSRHPPISHVSERMTQMKELENVRCPHINMDPVS